MLFPWFRQPVQSQIVFFIIDFPQKPPPKLFIFHIVYLTFKYRLLHPLPVRLAHLRHPPQAAPPRRRFRRHIVRDQHFHFAGP